MTASAALRNIDRIRAKCRAIHVARRQLELDDATYRALLHRAAGITSSTQINSVDKADAVLDALSRLGFQHKPKVSPGRHKGTPGNLDSVPYLQKIEALLADMELPWAYADTIAEHISGGKKPEAIKRLAWVKEQRHFVGIVAALQAEKKKRLDKARADLGVALIERGLAPQWAKDEAEAMGRLAQPWFWYECLDTLRAITARLPPVTKA